MTEINGYMTSEGWGFTTTTTPLGVIVHISHRQHETRAVGFGGATGAIRAKLFLAACTHEFHFENKPLESFVKRAEDLFAQCDESGPGGFEQQQMFFLNTMIWCRDTDTCQVELEFEPGMGTTVARMLYRDTYDAYQTLYGILCMLEDEYLTCPVPRL